MLGVVKRRGQGHITENIGLSYLLSTHTDFLLNSLPWCLLKNEHLLGSNNNQSNLNERLYC